MRFKAAIFDLDGTLVNSLSDIADSMNQVLKNHGFKSHQTDDYRYFVGEGMRTLVSRALSVELPDPAFIDLYTAEMKEEYEKRWNHKTSVYEGIPQLLKTMLNHSMSIAVLSNKPHNFTIRMIHHYFGNSTFMEVLGAGLFPQKPDPSGALHIVKQFNISSSEFLYVGDSAVDMKTAKSAGMVACGCLWGFRDRDELIDAGADKIVERPSQVEKIILESQ